MRVEVGLEFNQDYQDSRYRVRIYDDDGKLLIAGTKDYFTEEEALSDSKDLVRAARMMERGLGTEPRKWRYPGMHQRYFLFAACYFGVVFFLFLFALIRELYAFSFFVFFIPFIAFFFIAGYFLREKFIYLWDNNNLYAVLLINDDYVVNTRYKALNVYAFVVHGLTQRKINAFNDQAGSLREYDDVDIKKKIWEIKEVLSVVEYQPNKFCAKCRVEGYHSQKKKTMKLYLSDHYEDYETLVRYLNFIKENPVFA